MSGFDQFNNPFNEQVLDRTLGDIERTRQMQTNSIGASASAAGAFGGSRHGVAEAETNRAFADTAATTAAGLRASGFDSAVNNSFRNASAQGSASGLLGGLSGQAFGMGQSINDRQAQQGLLAQGMNQQLIDAARGRFGQFTGSPAQSLQYPLAAIGGVPHPTSSTTQNNPGLFNYLSLGMGLF